MTKEEFETKVGREVSPEDYQKIELVYMFHPLISETCEITEIYKHGGIGLIEDMEHTASRARFLKSEIKSYRDLLAGSMEEYKNLAARYNK